MSRRWGTYPIGFVYSLFLICPSRVTKLDNRRSMWDSIISSFSLFLVLAYKALKIGLFTLTCLHWQHSSIRQVYLVDKNPLAVKELVWDSGDLDSLPSPAMDFLRHPRQVIWPLCATSLKYSDVTWWVCQACVDCKLFRTGTVSYYVSVQHLAQCDLILVGAPKCYYNINENNDKDQALKSQNVWIIVKQGWKGFCSRISPFPETGYGCRLEEFKDIQFCGLNHP